MKNKYHIITSFILILLFSLPIYSKEIYVSPSGSNNQSGKISSPFSTINKALSIIKPGDTIICREGIYKEGLFISQGKTGGKFITLKSYPGEKAEIRPGKTYDQWINITNNKWTLEVNDLKTPSTIRLIKKERYGITQVNTLIELEDESLPPIAQKEDLFYVENILPNTIKITLKLPKGENPKEHIYIVDSTKRITIVSPYIEIEGFLIRYAYDGIKVTWTDGVGGKDNPKNNGDYAKITNNTIEHIANQGILAGQKGEIITGNTIRYCGKPFKYLKDENVLIKNNLDHCIYYTGSNATIFQNRLEKSHGQELTLWSSDYADENPHPQNTVVYNNLVIGNVVGSGINNLFYNNFILPRTDPNTDDFALTISNNSSYEIYHNLIRGKNGIYLWEGNSKVPTKIKNNIVIADSKVGYLLIIRSFNLFNIESSHNLYFGGTYFRVHDLNFVSFSKYKEYINNIDMDSNSFFEDPQLDKFYIPQKNSPIIDKGTFINSVKVDFLLNTRPSGKECDIGPIEYIQIEIDPQIPSDPTENTNISPRLEIMGF